MQFRKSDLFQLQIAISKKKHNKNEVRRKKCQRTEERVENSSQSHGNGHHIGFDYLQHETQRFIYVAKVQRLIGSEIFYIVFRDTIDKKPLKNIREENDINALPSLISFVFLTN